MTSGKTDPTDPYRQRIQANRTSAMTVPIVSARSTSPLGTFDLLLG